MPVSRPMRLNATRMPAHHVLQRFASQLNLPAFSPKTGLYDLRFAKAASAVRFGPI